MPEGWELSWDIFKLTLEGQGKRAETLRVCRTSVADFGQHLTEVKGSAPELAGVTREDVLRYLAALVKAGNAPATRHNDRRWKLLTLTPPPNNAGEEEWLELVESTVERASVYSKLHTRSARGGLGAVSH